ncbi:type II toxin-antitoxin system RelE/ParE family toxin [Candidatus Pacearchaeota archaeon]|nr:type II toxin-antitoxin system RelE/ParE family toxin [Candidatus Pacearchaeota archaeon]
MVKIDFDEHFKRTVSKIKNFSIKDRIEKLIIKIKNNLQVGKPMKHNRKGTREVYLQPFRLSYAFNKNNDTIVILDFYHKDEQ